ncbi:MAG TPA: glycosyltransferase family 39 protein [Patescibacteria group bacterium]|nr:glycosyltransferase family 39 protein [Patescibacteria group bacterium]
MHHLLQQKKKIFLAAFVLLVIVLAFFLRAVNIDTVPAGIYPDEAVNGMNAVDANATGTYPWFYPDNNGREGLFINLIAFSFKAFGISILTLKLPAIIISTLVVLGVYFLTRELFYSRPRIALIAAFLTATSYWAINFARIAFRANMLPLVLVFSFFFLFRGVRTGKMYNYALAGFIFGLGMHTYISFRIAPLILIMLAAAFILSYDAFLKRYWRAMVLFICAAILSAAPILWTFSAHPEYISSRTASISILSPDVNQGHIAATLLHTITLSIAKYNVWGDQNWRHNYPPYPLLDPISGTLFAIGIFLSAISFVRFLIARIRSKEKNHRLIIHTFLLAWFSAMLVPEFMTIEGLPHALRAIGTLPVVFILAAFAADAIIVRAYRFPKEFATLVTTLIVLALLVSGISNSVKYHVYFARNVQMAHAFNKNLTDIGRALGAFPQATEKYVIAGPLERLPIRLLNTDVPHVIYVYPHEQGDLIRPKGPFVIILTERNDALIAQLRMRFPQLQLTDMRNPLESVFYVLH